MKKYITTILAVLLMLTSAHAFTGDNANSLPFGASEEQIVPDIGDGSRDVVESTPIFKNNKKGGGSNCQAYEWIVVHNAPTPICVLEGEGRKGFWDLHSFLRK